MKAMKKFQTSIRYHQGFSLVEILITIGLTSGLALLGMQLSKNQSKSQRTIEANYEVASVLQQIKTILSKPENCESALQGLNPGSGTPTVLKKEVNSSFENVYQVNTWLPGNIKITSYSLANTYMGLATNETMLRINFSRGKGALKDESQKAIKIVYTPDGSGNISTCYAFNNNSDTYWIQSLTEPSDIYYMAGNVGLGVANPDKRLTVGEGARINGVLIGEGIPSVDMAYPYESIGVSYGMNLRLQSPNGIGFHTGMTSTEPDDNSKTRLWISQDGNVGIGTTNPTASLDVNGQLNSGQFRAQQGIPPGDFAQVGYAFGGDGDTGIFSPGSGVANGVVSIFSNATEVVRVSGGNVGIGTTTPTAKLDVNGSVKIGSAPDTCNASVAGQQRYKDDTKVMQYCNGTDWVTMGGGGGLDYAPLTDGLSWSSLTLSSSGGFGTSSGIPTLSFSTLGTSDCGPLSTITLNATGMTASTKAALVSFASFDNTEPSPAARIFTTGDRFIGLVGQSGRGGDGRSYGAGGEVMIPLSGKAFKIQYCKRGGGSSTFYYSVKGILN